MSAQVTDEQVQALAATGRPFTLAQLRWAPGRHQDGAASIELEHQRRMVAMHSAGVIAVLVPVVSDDVAGVALMTLSPEEARATMAGDPCVVAGMMTVDVLPCVAFPGDTVPG